MALLGIGMDKNLLWQEELIGHYFAKTRQHILSYKTNNNGTDITKELRSFTSYNPIDELQMTYVREPSPPSIRFERYNFNDVHSFTASNLFKLNNDAQLNTNIILCRNKNRSHGFAQTSYFLPGGSMEVITEDISARTTDNTVEGEFRYLLNRDYSYFNNYLNIAGRWNSISGEVVLDLPVSQRLNDKSIAINNTTHWIKRGETEKGVEIMLNNAFRSQPHQLYITPGLYPELFNAGNNYAELSQKVRNNAFVSNNRFSFLSALVVGNLRLNPRVNLDVEYQNLFTEINLINSEGLLSPILDPDMRNNIDRLNFRPSVAIDAVYLAPSFKIGFSLPLSYHYTIIDNEIKSNKNLRAGKFYLDPSISVKSQFSSQLEVIGKARFYSRTPTLPMLYTGYILQNYRMINRYDTQLFDTNQFFASLGGTYKNVPDAFFFRGDLVYNSYHRDGLYGQMFDGELSINELIMIPNKGWSLGAVGHLSKGFEWKALVFSSDVSVMRTTREQLRQGELINYKNQLIKASISSNLRLFHWMVAEYKASWWKSRMRVDGGETLAPLHAFTNRVAVDIFLPFSLGLKGSFEHYHNSAIRDNRNFFLADLGLTYVGRGVRYSLDWSNIFNTSKYISASYGALDSYYSEYDIRSMAIMLKVAFKLL